MLSFGVCSSNQRGNAINLTSHAATDRNPAWFPDGSAVAFVSDRNGIDEIWKVSSFGGAATLLLSNAVDPALSPDGTRLAFSRISKSGEQHIGVASLGIEPEVKILTQGAAGYWHGNPSWSQDGRTICYEALQNLYLISASGGRARNLTSDDEFDSESPAAIDD